MILSSSLFLVSFSLVSFPMGVDEIRRFLALLSFLLGPNTWVKQKLSGSALIPSWILVFMFGFKNG